MCRYLWEEFLSLLLGIISEEVLIWLISKLMLLIPVWVDRVSSLDTASTWVGLVMLGWDPLHLLLLQYRTVDQSSLLRMRSHMIHLLKHLHGWFLYIAIGRAHAHWVLRSVTLHSAISISRIYSHLRRTYQVWHLKLIFQRQLSPLLVCILLFQSFAFIQWDLNLWSVCCLRFLYWSEIRFGWSLGTVDAWSEGWAWRTGSALHVQLFGFGSMHSSILFRWIFQRWQHGSDGLPSFIRCESWDLSFPFCCRWIWLIWTCCRWWTIWFSWIKRRRWIKVIWWCNLPDWTLFQLGDLSLGLDINTPHRSNIRSLLDMNPLCRSSHHGSLFFKCFLLLWRFTLLLSIHRRTHLSYHYGWKLRAHPSWLILLIFKNILRSKTGAVGWWPGWRLGWLSRGWLLLEILIDDHLLVLICEWLNMFELLFIVFLFQDADEDHCSRLGWSEGGGTYCYALWSLSICSMSNSSSSWMFLGILECESRVIHGCLSDIYDWYLLISWKWQTRLKKSFESLYQTQNQKTSPKKVLTQWTLHQETYTQNLC